MLKGLNIESDIWMGSHSATEGFSYTFKCKIYEVTSDTLDTNYGNFDYNKLTGILEDENGRSWKIFSSEYKLHEWMKDVRAARRVQINGEYQDRISNIEDWIVENLNEIDKLEVEFEKEWEGKKEG